jgi:hypothetical protein
MLLPNGGRDEFTKRAAACIIDGRHAFSFSFSFSCAVARPGFAETLAH